ncbi:hypothetical protein DW886_16100 [Enterocloster aldenensis]|uniref:hypothetical protein n=1 Tax=Enterocloster aldenensis TaxID=358742 RepID=UPI000E49B270|nr:hypothetical protein DW886_16100 [Enterocloster aldenensis]
MLGKPKYGWCNIMVGQNKLGCASYLIDVPTYLLDVFNQYLSEENHLNFTVEFDAEGYFFGIIEFNETLYSIRDDTLDGNPVLQEISPTLLGLEVFDRAEVIKKLAYELIVDIETNLEDWVYWENDEESMETNESDNRRRMLQSKINELKEKIHG